LGITTNIYHPRQNIPVAVIHLCSLQQQALTKYNAKNTINTSLTTELFTLLRTFCHHDISKQQKLLYTSFYTKDCCNLSGGVALIM